MIVLEILWGKGSFFPPNSSCRFETVCMIYVKDKSQTRGRWA